METLDMPHPIREELLSQKYYFQSLVEQAHHCGLLSDRELSAIQTEARQADIMLMIIRIRQL